MIPKQLSFFFQNCNIPRWVWFYITSVVVFLPAILCLIFNVLIFIRVRESLKRTQPTIQIVQNSQPQTTTTVKLSHREIRLLLHALFMFSIFIVGWAPVYLVISIDYSGSVSIFVYVMLALWSEISVALIIIDLFIYNHELKDIIKQSIGNLHWTTVPRSQT